MRPDFFKNFDLAFAQLKSFIEQGIKDDLDRAGIIQAFEFTFEQAWKAVQKKAGEEAVSITSPKQAWMWAIERDWILSEKEHLWLEMLKDRNLTTHTYREVVAKQVAKNIVENYSEAFEGLLKKMKSKSRWNP